MLIKMLLYLLTVVSGFFYTVVIMSIIGTAYHSSNFIVVFIAIMLIAPLVTFIMFKIIDLEYIIMFYTSVFGSFIYIISKQLIIIWS